MGVASLSSEMDVFLRFSLNLGSEPVGSVESAKWTNSLSLLWGCANPALVRLVKLEREEVVGGLEVVAVAVRNMVEVTVGEKETRREVGHEGRSTVKREHTACGNLSHVCVHTRQVYKEKNWTELYTD